MFVPHSGKGCFSDLVLKITMTELNDLKSSLLQDGLNRLRMGEEIQVKDILEHKELFERQPFLKFIKINQTEWNGPEASFNRTKGITLSGKVLSSDELLGSLLHELQHAIQRENGWPEGGSLSEFSFVMNSEADLLAELKIAKDLDEDELREHYIQEVYRKLFLKNHFSSDPHAIYMHIWGEIQARAVQSRLYQTDITSCWYKEENLNNIIVPTVKWAVGMVKEIIIHQK